MAKSSKKSNRLTFPVRLHGLLTQAPKFGVDHIISWDDEGTKFLIHDQDQFNYKILPNIFRQSKFASFRRQLNAYGFERVFVPSNLKICANIAYFRKGFTRDSPRACKRISRQYANQALAEKGARLSSNEVEISPYSFSKGETFSAAHYSMSTTTYPRQCPSSCSSIIHNDGIVDAPSLVTSESASRIESFSAPSTKKHENTKLQSLPQMLSSSAADPLDSMLDKMLSMLDDDTPFHLAYTRTNPLASLDSLIESL
mmetsp:Transcript_3099/g.4695  ORF Transcript_3099/g.4695 Transcript_3099/m.4695 type:complete len:256 (-) Transcript_3099:14-781(-)